MASRGLLLSMLITAFTLAGLNNILPLLDWLATPRYNLVAMECNDWCRSPERLAGSVVSDLFAPCRAVER